MNLSLVERIVNAVLYEGYILYPYRPSAVKNQQRWNFGALYPPAYSEALHGTDACRMQTECLVEQAGETTLSINVRFLHLVARAVCKLTTPVAELPVDALPSLQKVAALEVGGRVFQSWQEAVERHVSASDLSLKDLLGRTRTERFSFPAHTSTESLRDASGLVVGLLAREQQEVAGALEISAEEISASLCKITVRILNLTPFAMAAARNRDAALLRALVSTHTILGARAGEFVSLLDPPAALRAAVGLCRNEGTWPVLVGAAGERDCLLSSPIILYDYPQVAPESAGALFDGTEIDEILTLRIMTLTEEEKREMRASDERAREILERTESMPAEQLMKLHGALRRLRPVEEQQS